MPRSSGEIRYLVRRHISSAYSTCLSEPLSPLLLCARTTNCSLTRAHFLCGLGPVESANNAYLYGPWSRLNNEKGRVVAIPVALCSLLPRIHSFHSPSATMEDHKTHGVVGEKYGSDDLSPNGRPTDVESLNVGENKLHRELKGRHMQMIAM
jgi:hypothetical protein